MKRLMDSRQELVIPRQKNPELQKDRLLDFPTRMIDSVEDEGIRRFVDRLFRSGGFIFEADRSGSYVRSVEGLVCAVDEDHIYQVGILGEKDPTVTLDVKNKEGKEIAHLTLSPPPNIRPDLWNRWENLSKPMTDEERSDLLKKFTHAKLDPNITRMEAVAVMWEILRGKSMDCLRGFLGNIRTMGGGWGDFVDAKNKVFHPQSPPRDVVYGYVLPDNPINFFDEPNIENLNLRSQVQELIFQRDRKLLNIVTLNEGITGHQVITFQDMDFRMLPTKRGLEIYDRIKVAIPVMVSSLTDEELKIIFRGYGYGSKPLTWDFIDQNLTEGIGDGFHKPIDYICPPKKTGDTNEICQEYTVKENSARRFRFLAQVFAQRIKTGNKWRSVKGKSQALMQIAILENRSADEITKKYGI